MIKVTEEKLSSFPMWIKETKTNTVMVLSYSETNQLFKKLGKILGKEKEWCPYCSADLTNKS